MGMLGFSRSLRRRSVLAGSIGLLASPSIVRAQASTGVALVIGNSKYKWEASLPNVKRDVTEIARRLQAYGLKTELLEDAGRDAMKRAVDKLAAASRGANLSAFYFAGHGVNDERALTYLVPVDVELSSPSAIKDLIPNSSVRDATREAANRLFLLDNCRNSPAEGWRQRSAADRGLSLSARGGGPAGERDNMLMLQSTVPGRIALDGAAGQFSPFAATLLRQLNGEAVDFQAWAGKARRDLLMATEARQFLWEWNTYEQRSFVLNGPGRIPGAQGAAAGWAKDPSRIIEVPQAYAFARQQGLPLPEGLIAHRPTSGSRDGRKVGTFRFDGVDKAPSLLVVMSVEERRGAELVLVSRAGGKGYWKVVSGTVSDEGIEFLGRERGVRYFFKWRGDDGGGVTMFPSEEAGVNGRPQSSSFARLDS